MIVYRRAATWAHASSWLSSWASSPSTAADLGSQGFNALLPPPEHRGCHLWSLQEGLQLSAHPAVGRSTTPPVLAAAAPGQPRWLREGSTGLVQTARRPALRAGIAGIGLGPRARWPNHAPEVGEAHARYPLPAPGSQPPFPNTLRSPPEQPGRAQEHPPTPGAFACAVQTRQRSAECGWGGLMGSPGHSQATMTLEAARSTPTNTREGAEGRDRTGAIGGINRSFSPLRARTPGFQRTATSCPRDAWSRPLEMV